MRKAVRGQCCKRCRVPHRVVFIERESQKINKKNDEKTLKNDEKTIKE